ncbi:hypothetical protein [Nocardioides conyzicola]|uniref:Uncharacterized protein n=1 Tax=Nocardioides conyzicola TaxID=1651781 RepID=A0ABP8XRC4_9ACTN
MSVREIGEPTRRGAALRAFLTIVLVTALVAAALGGATYVASRAFVGIIS